VNVSMPFGFEYDILCLKLHTLGILQTLVVGGPTTSAVGVGEVGVGAVGVGAVGMGTVGVGAVPAII
jgi:hypothetical protein